MALFLNIFIYREGKENVKIKTVFLQIKVLEIDWMKNFLFTQKLAHGN